MGGKNAIGFPLVNVNADDGSYGKRCKK